jgi:hypothetical protein
LTVRKSARVRAIRDPQALPPLDGDDITDNYFHHDYSFLQKVRSRAAAIRVALL